jgi:hypothetical protein
VQIVHGLQGRLLSSIHPRLLLRSLISSLFHDLFEIEQTQSCRCRNLLLISIDRTAVGLARCVSAPEVKGVCPRRPFAGGVVELRPFTPPLRHRSGFTVSNLAKRIGSLPALTRSRAGRTWLHTVTNRCPLLGNHSGLPILSLHSSRCVFRNFSSQVQPDPTPTSGGFSALG